MAVVLASAIVAGLLYWLITKDQQKADFESAKETPPPEPIKFQPPKYHRK